MGSKPHSKLTSEEKKRANERSIASRKRRLEQDIDFAKEYAEKLRQWWIANPKKVMVHGARARAKKAGVPCTISHNDFSIPDVCPVLGIPLFATHGSKIASSNSPSLDKIKPHLGYVPGNVIVISHRANVLKRDCINSTELRAVADWLDKQGSS